MDHSNLPFSEQYRIAAEDWSDKDAAARMLEETKSAVLAQMMTRQGDMAVSKAEMAVKASPEWSDFVQKMVNAKTAANKAKIRLDYIRMKAWEVSGQEATRRAEMRM